MDKVGFAVVGLGIWGETHVKTYAHHPNVDLVRVCDMNEDRAKQKAEEYSVGTYGTDFREVMDDPAVQAVSVVTPDFAHTDIAVAAAEAGKHILLEKPMATTVQDCQRILDAVEAAGVRFMVDFHNRFNPPIVQAKKAIETGELGEMQMMTVRLNDTIAVPTEWLRWAGKSSVLWFLASHAIDMIRWLFDDEVARVYSVSRSNVLAARGVETPDFFLTTLEMKRGGVASLENCWIISANAPIVFDFKAEIVGSDGTMYLDVSHHRMAQKYTKNDATYPDVICLPDVHGKPGGFAVESIRHFIDCVLYDKTPLVGGRDGLAATQAILAAMKSTREGVPVDVE